MLAAASQALAKRVPRFCQQHLCVLAAAASSFILCFLHDFRSSTNIIHTHATRNTSDGLGMSIQLIEKGLREIIKGYGVSHSYLKISEP
jgi:hypothetical protein